MLRLIVCGASGRMGRAITDLAEEDPAIKLVGLVEAKTSGGDRYGVKISSDLKTLLKGAGAVIDFTAPEASLRHAEEAAAAGVALVIGTTGIDEAGKKKLAAAAKKIPLVFSPNMSLSANVLFDAAERVAALLPGYDAEVVEIHHNLKKDSPSGTAKRLGEAIRRGKGKGDFLYGREGLVGQRQEDEIGIHAVRGGDVVGDHRALFLGVGERIELVHQVTSRAAFAAGAIAAAKWAAGKKPGLYDMRDVLGLKG